MAACRPLLFHPRAAIAAVVAFAALALLLAMQHGGGSSAAPPSKPYLLVPLFTFKALQPAPAAIVPRDLSRPCPVASRGCATIPCIQFVAAPRGRPSGSCDQVPRAKPHMYRIAR